jgi:hypothetical protein
MTYDLIPMAFIWGLSLLLLMLMVLVLRKYRNVASTPWRVCGIGAGLIYLLFSLAVTFYSKGVLYAIEGGLPFGLIFLSVFTLGGIGLGALSRILHGLIERMLFRDPDQRAAFRSKFYRD